MNKIKILYVFALVVTCTSCSQFKGKDIVRLDEYGISPGTGQNITPLINSIIDTIDIDNLTLVFAKGRYDFYPDSNYLREYFETNTYDVNPKRLAVLIEDKRNLTIDCGGSDFVFHGHIQPFTVDNSENIKITDVNIDWDQPLTAECRVLEADYNSIVVAIDTFQFPYRVTDKGLVFFADDWEAQWRLTSGSWLIEIDTCHIIPANTGDHGCVKGDLDNVVYTELKPGVVEMRGSFTKIPGQGHYLVMRHSTRDHAGIFLFHSENICLENINVYHTSGLGILSQYCKDIIMRGVNMIPNADKGRYLSGHDDGLHFMGCSGNILIDNCDAIGLMDDPVNIHGTYVPVKRKVSDTVLVCNYAHSMSRGLLWAMKGDTLAFIEKQNMLSAGTGIVEDFQMMGQDSFMLEFKTAIPGYVNSGFSLENLSCTPDVVIRNCFAGSCRARGYLISTPGKVLIENNVFQTSGSAILIAGDANYWYESGAVNDIVIRDNAFLYTCNSSPYQFCEAVISIYPEIPLPDPEHPFHANITIEDNNFNPADYPVLYARSVENLSFINNSIKRSYNYIPWHQNNYNFLLEACRNVVIGGNYIGNEVRGRNMLLKNMDPAQLILQDDEIRSIDVVENKGNKISMHMKNEAPLNKVFNNVSRPVKYLALGDSYTIGESVDENDRWPVIFAAQLNDKGMKTSNPLIIARTGWTTGELLSAIEESGTDAKFDLVSLCIGVNNQYRGLDIDLYRIELSRLLDIAIDYAGGNPSAVIVLSIPDYGVSPFASGSSIDGSEISGQIDMYNNIKKEECLERGVNFINITGLSRLAANDVALFAEDGLHYSGRMHKLWVDEIIDKLFTK